jgi:citrate lyase alpha subunit
MKGWKLGLIAAGLLVWTLGAIGSAQAASTGITCTPTESMTYSARIHVKCASAVGGIIYFALGTHDEAAAARALSVINTALVAGRSLAVLYDPADTSGTTIGCLASDCRLIQAVGIK